ncbi:MAG: nucleotidyltransferase domain-containing protein [Prevotellaceae bacterium]|jgi:predicted nucleotidyltransferase|nr:nucleotidyltransferase domain-containing protein [Prevotellaceae bacterium]
MDKNQALILAKQYKELVSARLPVTALYLYGSYSRGEQTEESDIDIAVVVSHRSENYFEDTPLLWTLRRQISNLIEPVLLTENEDDELYRIVLATGIRV